MASEDALAPGHGRRRWFGGRATTSETPTQEREGEMAPSEPLIDPVTDTVIDEVSAKFVSAAVLPARMLGNPRLNR